MSDTILKWDYPRTIPAKFGLIWLSGFRDEDLNVIFYQNSNSSHLGQLKKFLFLVTAAILYGGRDCRT
jgi:hypothetical protein